jgi:Alpha-L-arabinofuranosidase B, catalytic
VVIAYWFIAAMLLAVPAQAQSLGVALLGLDAARASGGGGGGMLGILPTPSGAYSFRKLVTAYVGKAVQLRRASDNAVQDIGFIGGDFDTASATTFCNATSCFGAAWYDQSGGGFNISAAAGNQPALVFSCLGTFPCFRFTALTQSLGGAGPAATSGQVSYSAVAKRTGTGACFLMAQYSGGNRLQGQNGAPGVTMIGGADFSSISTTLADGVWRATTGAAKGVGSTLSTDGSTVNGTVNSTTAAGLAIQGVATTTCDQTEGIFWVNYVLTAGDITTLNTNQHTYWGF